MYPFKTAHTCRSGVVPMAFGGQVRIKKMVDIFNRTNKNRYLWTGMDAEVLRTDDRHIVSNPIFGYWKLLLREQVVSTRHVNAFFKKSSAFLFSRASKNGRQGIW